MTSRETFIKGIPEFPVQNKTRIHSCIYLFIYKRIPFWLLPSISGFIEVYYGLHLKKDDDHMHYIKHIMHHKIKTTTQVILTAVMLQFQALENIYLGFFFLPPHNPFSFFAVFTVKYIYWLVLYHNPAKMIFYKDKKANFWLYIWTLNFRAW